VHYWADLQSVHGFYCDDNIAGMKNVIECLYSLYASFLVGVNAFSFFECFTTVGVVTGGASGP